MTIFWQVYLLVCGRQIKQEGPENQEGVMNELAGLVPFIFNAQACRITDRDGNPWFAVKDVCAILEIKNPSQAVQRFPSEEKAMITTISTTYSGAERPIPHKLLIINEAGVMRLILKSRKPNAWEFKERIILYPTSGRRA